MLGRFFSRLSAKVPFLSSQKADLGVATKGALGVDAKGRLLPISVRQVVLGLLIEVSRRDGVVVAAEQLAVSAIAEQFLHLNETEIAAAFAEDEKAPRSLGDVMRLDTVARALNVAYTVSQRVLLLSLCWRVMMADGEGSPEERRFVRQIGYRLLLNEQDVDHAFDTAVRLQ